MLESNFKHEVVFETYMGRERVPVKMTRSQFEQFRDLVLQDEALLEAIAIETRALNEHEKWVSQNPFKEEDLSKRAPSQAVQEGFMRHMSSIESDKSKAQVLVGFAGKLLRREVKSRNGASS